MSKARHVLDDLSAPEEERIAMQMIEYMAVGEPIPRIARLSPRSLWSVARRTNTKYEGRRAGIYSIRIDTPCGPIDVFADVTMSDSQIVLAYSGHDYLLTTPLAERTALELEQRFEIEESAATEAMQRAEDTRSALRDRINQEGTKT